MSGIPMITLANGKKQCPQGFMQKPPGSGNCVPSRAPKRPRSPAAALLLPPPPHISISSDSDSSSGSSTGSSVVFVERPPMPAMVKLSTGKLQCPKGYTQYPRHSGKCIPSKTRRRPLPPAPAAPSAPVLLPLIRSSQSRDTGSSSSSTGSSSTGSSSTGSSSTGSSSTGSSSTGSSSTGSSESSTGSSSGSESSPGSSISTTSSSISSKSSSRKSSPGSSISSQEATPSTKTISKTRRAPPVVPPPIVDQRQQQQQQQQQQRAALAVPYYTAPQPVPVLPAAATASEAPQQKKGAQSEDAELFDAERSAYEKYIERYRTALAVNPVNPFAPQNDEDDALFPEHDDPLFALQLARRAEFADTAYDGTIAPKVAERADEVCNAPFEILPNQRFAQSLLNPDSPLNAAFLYHELGTGKTFTCQTITEQFRLANKAAGVKRLIYIVCNPNVQDNFTKQLFDPSKLKNNAGVWEMPAGTIGAQILRELNPSTTGQQQQTSVAELLEGAANIIKSAYVFEGYTTFANRVHDLALGAKLEGRYEKRDFSVLNLNDPFAKRRLREKFDNCFIAVDEAHNINQRGSVTAGNNAAAVETVAKICNITLLLMSATPMFNSHRELVPLVNLLNAVDRRAPISNKQVFDDKGMFLAADAGRESGRDLLARKLTGYVSYVRGETPYAFPFRLLPDSFLDMNNPEDARHRLIGYPSRQLNGHPMTAPPKHTQVFACPMMTYQRRVYLAQVMQMELRTKSGVKKPSSSSSSSSLEGEGEEAGGEGDDEEEDDLLSMWTKSSSGSSSSSSGSSRVAADENLADLPDNAATMEDDSQEGYNYSKMRPLLNMATIVYPHAEWDKHLANKNPVGAFNPDTLKKMTGLPGLSRYMRYDGAEGANKKQRNDHVPMKNFRYRGGLPNQGLGQVRIFSPKIIGAYSAKIDALVKRVCRSTGIVLIFTNFIDACLIPIALALEQAGFMGVEGTGAGTKQERMLWHPQELQDVQPFMVPAEEGVAESSRACYTLVTGRKSLSPNNAANVELAVGADNLYGHRVKVVIFTVAGSESVDYKAGRQVCVMDPWFNLNRLEQVVGRGVRNRSHCGIPFPLRNTEVYYFASVLGGGGDEDDDAGDDDDDSVLSITKSGASLASRDIETVDLYLYRYCEAKELLMAPARRLMKEISVDCLTNRGQQNFTQEQMNETVELELSTDKRHIQFQVGDKPFTNMCDYMENCQYQCYAPSVILSDVVNNPQTPTTSTTAMTYGPRALRKDEAIIIRRIQDLYREKSFYRFDELRAHLTVQRKVPEAQIYAAVQALVRDPSLYLVNSIGQRGRMVSIKRRVAAGASKEEVWYMFQPMHITDRAATVFERSTRAVDRPSVVGFARDATTDNTAAALTSAPEYNADEPDKGDTPSAVSFRASLAPHLLAHLLAKVVFKTPSGVPADVQPWVSAAAQSMERLWYETMGKLVVDITVKYPNTVTLDELMWTVAQFFLDCRPAQERACMLMTLLKSSPGLFRTQAQIDEWRLKKLSDIAESSADNNWNDRVRFCMVRYFADRVYLHPTEDDRVAVFADMTKKSPELRAVILQEEEQGQGQEEQEAMEVVGEEAGVFVPKLTSMQIAGEWVEPAVRARNRLPTDLLRRVEVAREENSSVSWPVLVPSISSKYTSGGWQSAVELRIKNLTNTVRNVTGGAALRNLNPEAIMRDWQDVQLIQPCGPSLGEAFLRDKKGFTATVAYGLMLTTANLRGCFTAMTGEALAVFPR